LSAAGDCRVLPEIMCLRKTENRPTTGRFRAIGILLFIDHDASSISHNSWAHGLNIDNDSLKCIIYRGVK
jgi:hypothetical protein